MSLPPQASSPNTPDEARSAGTCKAAQRLSACCSGKYRSSLCQSSIEILHAALRGQHGHRCCRVRTSSRSAAVRDAGDDDPSLEDGAETLDHRRPAASPRRPGLGVDHARVPGPHDGHRDLRNGGEPTPPHQARVVLYGDWPHAGSGRIRHRRQDGAQGATGNRQRRMDRGARSGGSGAREGAPSGTGYGP